MIKTKQNEERYNQSKLRFRTSFEDCIVLDKSEIYNTIMTKIITIKHNKVKY